MIQRLVPWPIALPRRPSFYQPFAVSEPSSERATGRDSRASFWVHSLEVGVAQVRGGSGHGVRSGWWIWTRFLSDRWFVELLLTEVGVMGNT